MNSVEMGRQLARVLAGAWRANAPPTNSNEAQLDPITPSLLQSGAAALAYWRLRDSSLRDTVNVQTLRADYQTQALRTVLRIDDIQTVVTDLAAAGIEPLLFKGWAIARLYPDPALRPYTDIDLFVRPEKYQAAHQIVRKKPLHQLAADLHTETEDGTHATHLAGRGLEDLYAHSLLVPLNDMAVRVLAPEDHLHLLALHALRHGVWQPLWLCDLAIALEARPRDFDWARCLGQAHEADYIACALGLAHELLDAQIDDTPIAKRAHNLPRWLVPAVLQQWAHPDPMHHMTPDSIRSTWKQPRRLAKAVRSRWIDPLQATMLLNGSLNETPRVVYQVRYFLNKGTRFALRPFHLN